MALIDEARRRGRRARSRPKCLGNRADDRPRKAAAESRPCPCASRRAPPPVCNGHGSEAGSGRNRGKRGEDSARRKVMGGKKEKKREEKQGRKRPPSRGSVQAAEDGLRKGGGRPKAPAPLAAIIGLDPKGRPETREIRLPACSDFVFRSSRSSGPSGAVTPNRKRKAWKQGAGQDSLPYFFSVTAALC